MAGSFVTPGTGDAAGKGRSSSLSVRFTVVTAVILQVGMLVIGEWVARRVVEGVVRSHAAAAALYTDSFLEVPLQELRSSATLSPESMQALDALLLPQAVRKPIVAFRIWKSDTVVYAEDRSVVGRSFPPSPMRTKAQSGDVAAAYRPPLGIEPANHFKSLQPLLEIYAPVRSIGTNEIVALAETYQLAPGLAADAEAARRSSWILIGLVTLGMFLLQSTIVDRASRTIEHQGAKLGGRVRELSRMLQENTGLRHAKDAGLRVTEENEHALRRIGADLHDGPIQMIAMSLLRLDALGKLMSGADHAIAEDARQDVVIVRDALTDTLDELRTMAAGLTLPQLEKLPVPELLRTVARRHERLTGTSVACDLEQSLVEAPLSLKVCLYRFAQEGLNNAFLHADGNGQQIASRFADGQLLVQVTDDGPSDGATADRTSPDRTSHVGQGLIGLRDRVQSLGGRFSYDRRPCGGTKLSAAFHTTLAVSTHEDTDDRA